MNEKVFWENNIDVNNIRNWIDGYVEVLICGNDKERFITLCKNNKIGIFNLKNIDKGYICNMDIVDYKRVKKVVRKTHIMPRIISKKGLPFMYSTYKNRQSFVVGLILGIFLFYISSLFVWNIQIEGENYYTDFELLKYLKSENIKTGIR